jgi:hypothetical protein
VTVSTLVEPAYRSIPPYAKTLGPEVAGLNEMAGFAPDPEQRLALDAIFGMGRDNKVAALEAGVIACRQNIKTGLFKQCALGWLFITDQRLIVWSAHEFSTAQEAHRDLTELITNSDPLRKRVKAILNGNGEEGIELLTGQRIRFKARTKTGGRGLSGDKLVLDEAFALQPEHMASLFPTLSVRPDPQVLYGSSAGLTHSRVLRAIRDRGRAGGDPRLVYLEWTDDLPGGCESPGCQHELAAVGCRLDDEQRWHRANSQLGRRLPLEYVRAERRALPPAEFARERMGWWDEDEATVSALDLTRWLALADPDAERGTATFAVATAPDRSWSAVGVAWTRPDGRTQLMLADYRPGATWVEERVRDIRSAWNGSVLVNPAARGLVDDALEPSQQEQAQAHNALYDAVEAGTVRHSNEPALNTAVRAARWRPLGDTRVLDRKGDLDISPLDAVALAAWGLATASHGGWMLTL